MNNKLLNNKLLSCLIAGALGTTLALASPALAFHGGGGGGGGGMGGGVHAGSMGGGMSGGGMSSGARFGAMSGGPAFSGSHTSMAFAHPGFTPRSSTFRSSTFAGRDHDRNHFDHHRFHRFAFGVPYGYAAYDSCWRREWTPYGLRWVDVCNDYGY